MIKNWISCVICGLLGCHGLAQAAIDVTDGLGRRVSLPHPAERIVALAPHIVENLFQAGAGQQIAAGVDYSDYPEAAKALPRVGGYTSFSIEAVLAMQPDLVVLWDSGSRPELLQQLTQLGLTVYVDRINYLDDIAASIHNLGTLAGHEQQALAAARDFRQQLSDLRNGHINSAPVSVFYQVWDQPLMTINGHNLIAEAIELCGGYNLFGNEPMQHPKVSLESVLEANPEVVIASGMGEERPDWLDAWRQYPSLQAVVHDNLFFVPPSVIQRSTPRILIGAGKICQSLDQARQQLEK